MLLQYFNWDKLTTNTIIVGLRCYLTVPLLVPVQLTVSLQATWQPESRPINKLPSTDKFIALSPPEQKALRWQRNPRWRWVSAVGVRSISVYLLWPWVNDTVWAFVFVYPEVRDTHCRNDMLIELSTDQTSEGLTKKKRAWGRSTEEY